ncbi:MAG TPA: ribulose-phosphate 3-epimerase [Ignavibacteriaceae bacterium]|nr:ribulose-phosphate 3-epimerase [Ignavibacteriaceae bacterium]
MNSKKIIAPSILSADFSVLKEQIQMAEEGGAEWIHCDIMDGHFVPNLTFGPFIVESVKKSTSLIVDVHLMIKNPDQLIPAFIDAGADYVTVHIEEVVHLNRTINRIKELGAKAGVVLNPSTPITFAEEILSEIDLLLLMSVNPGFGGQKFISSVFNKISSAKTKRELNNFNYMIEVDGGVTENNIQEISYAGCDVFVAGSAIFGKSDVTSATSKLLNLVKK